MAVIFFGLISFILSYHALKASAYYDPAPYENLHCPIITPENFESIKEMGKVPSLEGGRDWFFDSGAVNQIRNPQSISLQYDFVEGQKNHAVCKYLIIDQNRSQFSFNLKR